MLAYFTNLGQTIFNRRFCDYMLFDWSYIALSPRIDDSVNRVISNQQQNQPAIASKTVSS